jgi:phosphoadenosine phosphosulfate reductase
MRVGCLFCPMSVKKADYIKQAIYPNEIEKFVYLIKKTNGRNYGVNSYITDGGWVSRRSGRDLLNNAMNYSETIKDKILTITVINPKSNWQEWYKTIEGFTEAPYTIEKHADGYTINLPEEYIKINPKFGKFFKQVFRKSAYCIHCGVCETNCSSGHLKFDAGLSITNCEHCMKCHDIEDGCLAYIH